MSSSDSKEMEALLGHKIGLGIPVKELPAGYTPINIWQGRDEPLCQQVERAATPAELREQRYSFYKTWSYWRMHAGGPDDTLFFTADLDQIANLDPKQVGVLKLAPAVPGKTQGWWTGNVAEQEWRIKSGKYVKITGKTSAMQPFREAGFEEEKHPRGKTTPESTAGSFAPGGGGEGHLPQTKDAERFIEERNKSKRPEYLSPITAEDLKEHRLFMSPDGKTGCALGPDGDCQNLFNNGPKGAGALALMQQIELGGRTLDCYADYLPMLYAQVGFLPYQQCRQLFE